MTPPLAVVTAAEVFWAEAGGGEAFPRDVRRAVARAQPVAIVLLPALHVAKADAWLRRQGLRVAMDVADRPLRACLVAHAGNGIIFVDGADAEDEQRFSIAHELAHFLLDYQQPRRAVEERLGASALEVLDGHRPARPEERIAGILADVEVRPHVHLMGRFDELNMPGETAWSETAADALAFELLAPWEIVAQQIARPGRTGDRAAVAGILMARFGLPRQPAEQYAARLCPAPSLYADLFRHLKAVELLSPARNIQQDG